MRSCIHETRILHFGSLMLEMMMLMITICCYCWKNNQCCCLVKDICTRFHLNVILYEQQIVYLFDVVINHLLVSFLLATLLLCASWKAISHIYNYTCGGCFCGVLDFDESSFHIFCVIYRSCILYDFI